ncbi:putative transcriptional regulator YwtF [Fervidicola ferrireducens]|uniref:Putative transcriptional regulator YwtF n=1 Tax=Fervidicola ferrireducens TaxID=520764 RepID=A0A140LCQ5_9FIRM|nr:LCP family protein [Fervidicola ferrireducens]KXG78330.1 putative transcriptional regulator YwtF [Fervidicola ferrireducens]
MKPLGRKKRFFIIVAFFIAAVILSYAGFKYYQIYKSLKNMEKEIALPPKETEIGPLKPVNILLLGVDSGEFMGTYRQGRGRADTIMLFAVRPAERKIIQVSIPRDSRVEVPGHGVTKINHAYAYGGAELMQKTIEKLLDIKIDRVVVLNYSAFVQLVDRLGGVTLDVEEDINNRFNIGKPIPTGHVKLTGEEAFRYVHARDSDIERIKRQQKFLQSVFSEIKQEHAYTELLDYIVENPKVLTTNFSLSEIIAFLKNSEQLEKLKLESVLLKGKGQYINGISYWILDEEHLKEIRKMIGS